MNRREYLSTPMFEGSIKIMLLGSGELGKEVAIEAQRLGLEVIAVDRYEWAPAMHVAHRRYVIDMLNPNALKAVVRKEKPDVIIPEIEAIAVDALEELESEGFYVVPNARAVKIAMNRIELRKFAAEVLGLPTTRYRFAENPDEAVEACEEVGIPCLIKPEMSSSGHGHAKVLDPSPKVIREAYEYAVSHARGRSRRVIVEEFVQLETEFTVLSYRYVADNGVVTETCEPVEHWRYGEYHYIESWQPSSKPMDILNKAREIGIRVANGLGGFGIFGVEIFLTKDGRVLFSEVAPRPHDTGMVTMVSQELSEFAIHVRAAIGLPVPKPKVISPGASLAIYVDKDGIWAPKVYGVYNALKIPGVDIRIFGKPFTYKGRRMAVLLARGSTVEEALEKVRNASKYTFVG
ncbi:Phosphoribosylaminoimidazole carboxylase [Ignisphaera aggregans DSM 17230]|uniref:Formate-dependent phosphoribosylglycinamide formyltransferase n=1 Tax=Ignisphaera aggregans (strain DSM 17230 / JCM 13409 / AQ1.S1) TaxID=583356 RepID=E0SQP3_IGNAA|nr:Phosphoribosylaminoimidazole carboxylase [Ignisphaera aggregans DSM 17230]